MPPVRAVHTSAEELTSKVWLNADTPDDKYPLYSTQPIPPKKPGTVRVWVDGCFDMLHFGHANALRQAAQLSTELFVGCHSDEEIMRHKGPPIMKEEERYEALRACKWVHYVVENYPYCTRLKDMDRFEIDFVVHGDDVSLDSNGRNSYQEIIDAGRFKVVKRTEGVSTTDLVGRMLLCTKSHMINSMSCVDLHSDFSEETVVRPYLTTSRKIVQFSNNRCPQPGDRIVYVDGSFDLFHVGHIRVLEKARQLGDYLIAGIFEDKVVNQMKGMNYPIMNFNERVLGVLSCRYVDEVVMGVPYLITKDVVDSLKIDVVVSGKAGDLYNNEALQRGDPYAVPKELGIFCEVDSGCDLTTDNVINRVMENHAAYVMRQSNKRKSEKQGQVFVPSEYRNPREVE